MSHVLFMIAACMLLFDSTAHAGGYKNGRIRPERDPATLYHNFKPVELQPQEQLARVRRPRLLNVFRRFASLRI